MSLDYLLRRLNPSCESTSDDDEEATFLADYLREDLLLLTLEVWRLEERNSSNYVIDFCEDVKSRLRTGIRKG